MIAPKILRNNLKDFFKYGQIMLNRSYCKAFPGEKVTIDGQTIHYEKVGTGSHPVLLLPGALGTTQTDFKPQLDNLNRENLAIIAWDPPGYGFSRPANRKFHMDMFQEDAGVAVKLMKQLNYNKFSTIGWSDGGITALFLAAIYPQVMNKMVIFGANSFISDSDVKLYNNVRDIAKWSDKMKAPMVNVYGLELFKDMWETWCDTCNDILKFRGGNLCREHLKNIRCPTLIIHGQKDAMVIEDHPILLNKHIENSRLKVYPDGKHNLHLKYWKEFNKDCEDFLLD